MSIVSSYFSSRAPVFRINVQFASIMDSIFAIAIGLGVRVVIDGVSHQDNRITGTLVGLWEGVVMQHFLKKMPKSSDPFVAYGVRLFVDFLFTESLSRLVLTLIWTGMGIVLADVVPAIWVDTGMRRSWRHFRRDLYIIIHSMPTIPWFARPRTVRFSPSRATSIVSSVPPSVVTNDTRAQASRLAPPAPTVRKRPVPGAFPGDASETETDLGSVLGSRSPGSAASTSPGTAHHRFSSLPRRRATVETESELSYDLDEGNISTSDSAYTRTPTLNDDDMPTIEDEEDARMEREIALEKGKQKEDESTPKQNPMVLPPTPSDSAFAIHQPPQEPEEVQPPVAEVPNIPDDEDWENISRREALNTPPPGIPKDDPPTPPAKDTHPQPQSSLSSSSSTPPPLQAPPPATSTSQKQAEGMASDPRPDAKSTVDDLPTSNPTPLFKQSEGNPWATPVAKPAAEAVTAAATTSTTSGSAPAKPASTTGSVFGAKPASKAPSATGSTWEEPPAKPESVTGSMWGAAAPIKPAKAPAWGAAKPTTAATTQAAGDGMDFSFFDQPSSYVPFNFDDTKPSTSAFDLQTSTAAADKNAATTKAGDADAMNFFADGDTFENKDKADDTSDPKPNVSEAEASSTVQEAASSPAVVDDVSDTEPLPGKSSERLKRSLELRKQAVEMEKGLKELKRQMSAAWDDDEVTLAVQKQLLVDASMREVEKVNSKAERWYAAAVPAAQTGAKNPADINVEDLKNDIMVAKVEEALTHLALKNQPTLKVTIATTKKGGRAQKVALTALLNDLDLKVNENPSNAREFVVTLPSTPTES
ncbi:hypothetical protein D9615_002590 [Tricholomella constricta]|uniref:Uncharacterized protein n=1 Tax=Tricholomella constricta TaxID=117010 RepID=A0A8H5HMM8_9AGAR|nr:hypothetical protein D9615_002590 [Tricholomella constricta]